MNKLTKWALLGAMVAALGACANVPPTQKTAQADWNQGVWNSVLGYNGPANERSMQYGAK